MNILLRHPFTEHGFKTKLARMMGLAPCSIYQWGRVPAGRVLDVERLTGIPRHELRPDIYPAPSPEGEAA